MLKRFAFLAASVFALAMLVPAPVFAQSTDQTDQSEEDWRRSKKKRSSDRNDPTRSLPGLGGGIPIPPLEPIDTLPEDSRRHLQRQRAKVIAEVEFGEIPEDVPYEPSEAAKTDPELAAEEEEAWEIILTDLQGGPGGGAPTESGPNRVAVAGRGGSSAGSVTRGGSSQSAADILAQLKGLQRSGAGTGTDTGSRGSGGSGQPAQGTSTQAGGSQGTGQTPTNQTQGTQDQQGDASQGQNAGAQSGQQQAGQGQAGQSQSQDGAAEAGQQQGGQAQSQQDQNQDGQGQNSQNQAGQGPESGADGDGAQNDAGADSAAAPGASASSSSPLGPLDRTRSQGPLTPGSGAQSSASDFLKGQGESPSTPDSPAADD